ncbi:type II and III secretion system protein family protein [Pseudomonas sp. EL_65y_Pfl2_R95]|uniref:type II and III secretion system protein family protein n=1 Tax=Pseudomonas sp. EL_65y_Pfl2_R95 TaxID=3088698 RepID=UPI0030D8234F
MICISRRIVFSLSLISCAGISSGVASAAAAGCSSLTAVPAVVEVGQSLQQQIRYPTAIKRLAIGDPEIADVRLTANDSFLLTGKKSGATSLMVWTSCSAEPRSSMVYVEGLATAALARPVQPDSLGMPVSQVQTDIRFVEVSRSKMKQASTSIFGTGSNNFLFGAPGTVGGVTVSPGLVGGISPAIPLVNSGFNIVFGGGSSKVLGLLNALENSGFAYTLAKPSLVALSGQSASFLAGGEFPVPVPSAGSDNISIEYKEFGVRLTLTPTVVGNNRINLKVAPEVSELNFQNGIEIAGTTVPALNVRRTDTSISLADGESFVISGLISSSNRAQLDKFPGLGDIPVLGALFRSTNISREDSELLMIVTPHLVQPLAATAQMPSLPGENLRHYDPNFFKMYFFENGNFDKRSGLSQ